MLNILTLVKIDRLKCDVHLYDKSLGHPVERMLFIFYYN